MTHPKLRPLESFMTREGDEPRLALRDPEGYTDKVVLLAPLEALIVSRLDGSVSGAALMKELRALPGGENIPDDHIERLLEALDEHLMLDSKRFKEHKAGFLRSYREAPQRPPLLAGVGYPDDAKALTGVMEGLFGVPGAPEAPPEPDDGPPLTGLVAPHIDFPRGRAAYACSYGEVLRAGLADLYVIFGVAHAGPETPLALTRKDYGTPFGPARVDQELAAALLKAAPYDLLADELSHRTEHSIELQAVPLGFVRQRLGGDFQILPLLCSSCDLEGTDPGARTLGVLKKLTALLRSYPGKVCLLAGVDLAHIGPCFGDSEPVTPDRLLAVAAEDRKTLDRLLVSDAKGVLDTVMHDGNKRQVCGVNAMHAMAWVHKKLHPRGKGKLLYYGHAADPSGGEVTFASAVFR